MKLRRKASLLATVCILATLSIPSCRKKDAASPSTFAGSTTPDRFKTVFEREQDTGKLTARFLKLKGETDTGSGDSTILTSPDGKIMLIDSGAPICAPQVEKYLQAMNVEKIDAIVATHPHIDHIGGLTQIIYKYPVAALYMPEIDYPTETYRGFMAAIEKRAVPVEYLHEGSEFAFGSEVKVLVFNPEATIKYPEDYPENSTQFINNRSLVLKFVFRESTMLFMSDVYMAREAELIEKFGDALKADVIKVGHHGKDTSSTKPFVRLIQPKIAVIMHDGVASVQVYKNYRRVEAAVYLTHLDGSVKVSADGTRNYLTLTQMDRQSDFLK